MVYTWFVLLKELGVWGSRVRNRIESNGMSACDNFCKQMCMTKALLSVLQRRPGLSKWFDVDPVPGVASASAGSICITTPTGPHKEYALSFLRKNPNIEAGECDLETLNSIQKLGSGVNVNDANTSDFIGPTHDPWSDKFECGNTGTKEKSNCTSPLDDTEQEAAKSPSGDGASNKRGRDSDSEDDDDS